MSDLRDDFIDILEKVEIISIEDNYNKKLSVASDIRKKVKQIAKKLKIKLSNIDEGVDS